MDCYVGAATGALKGAVLRDNTFQNLNEIKSLKPKDDEVTAMIWNEDQQTELLVARMNRQLQIYDIEENEQNTLLVVEGGTGAIKGIHKYDDRIFTCVESGELKVFNENSAETITEWKVGSGVSMLRGSSDKKEIVTGGIKNLVKTWDAETGKQVWSARNVPPDMLGLEIPLMCTDVRYIPGQNTILEASKVHEMRVYDPRAQRRPIKRINFMENPIMCTSLTHRDNIVLAANSIGEMGLFDLRSKVHPICKFKGQVGSIRSIDAHPTEPICSSVGIDRFLRVHDLNSRKLIHKIYCKTRMNKVLLRDNLSILNDNNAKKEIDEDESEYGKMKSHGYRSDGDSDESEEDDDEDDNGDIIWNELETKSKKSNKRTEEHDSDDSQSSKPKKSKNAPRKRKDSEDLSDVEEVAVKKSKLTKGKKRKEEQEIEEVEIKEEVDSDGEPTEIPKPKKKKILKKKKV